MKTEKITVRFYQGYGGMPKCEVGIDKKDYVLEISYLSALIEKMIEEKGYTTSISNRQKYPRLTINP